MTTMGSGESTIPWRREPVVSRALLVGGMLIIAAIAILFASQGALKAVPIGGGLTSASYLAAVWLGRVRSHERWERAWDRYASLQEPSAAWHAPDDIRAK